MAETAPRPDAALPCRPVRRMWALIQTMPTVEVLATATDRSLLVDEAVSLYGLDLARDRGEEPTIRLALRPTLLLDS